MTEAILLVGGKGTRLRPMTVNTPKPMVTAAGVPFLTHQLARARAAGVEHIVLATSYLAEVFEPYFGDGSALGLHLEYVTEKEPLGTGGAIRNVASRLRSGPDEPVLIFNGDILTGLDIRALVDTHRTSGADISLHLTRVEDPRAFGLVPTDATGRVTAFLEKPQTPEEIVTDQINAGAYVFRRSVIDTIPAGRPVSVERETFPGPAGRRRPPPGHGRLHVLAGPRHPQAFVRGSADLVLGRAPSPAVPGRRGERLVIEGAEVAQDAKLTGGTVVCAGAVVGAGATVDGSVVMAGATVEPGAVVVDSLVGEGARIGPARSCTARSSATARTWAPTTKLRAAAYGSGAAPTWPPAPSASPRTSRAERAGLRCSGPTPAARTPGGPVAGRYAPRAGALAGRAAPAPARPAPARPGSSARTRTWTRPGRWNRPDLPRCAADPPTRPSARLPAAPSGAPAARTAPAPAGRRTGRRRRGAGVGRGRRMAAGHAARPAGRA